MSADKYPCIFSRQMETIVYLSRLRKLDDLYFMVQGNPNQFKPVCMLNE